MPLKKVVAGLRPQDQQVLDMDPVDEDSVTLKLPQARRDKREEIEAKRLAAERAGIEFQAKTLPTDPDALARLAVLAQRAEIARRKGQTIQVRFPATDDTFLTLNANEVLDLMEATGDRFIALSQNARTLRQAVNAAATVADVLAINTDTGW